MLTLEDLMETSVTTLAERQEKALLEHALRVLDGAKKALTTGDKEALDKITFDSPAGDGYGLDNRRVIGCLNFQYRAKKNEPIDIAEVFGLLHSLRRTAKGK